MPTQNARIDPISSDSESPADAESAASESSLTPTQKAARRRSWAEYRWKHEPDMRESAKLRMRAYWTTADATPRHRQLIKDAVELSKDYEVKKKQADATYRAKHAQTLAFKQHIRQQKAFVAKHGEQAFRDCITKERATEDAAWYKKAAKEGAALAAHAAAYKVREAAELAAERHSMATTAERRSKVWTRSSQLEVPEDVLLGDKRRHLVIKLKRQELVIVLLGVGWVILECHEEFEIGPGENEPKILDVELSASELDASHRKVVKRGCDNVCPGDEDITAHSYTTGKFFYIVGNGHIRSIYTQEGITREQVKRLSHAAWKKSRTWDDAVVIWNRMCARYHTHSDLPASASSPSPPPPLQVPLDIPSARKRAPSPSPPPPYEQRPSAANVAIDVQSHRTPLVVLTRVFSTENPGVWKFGDQLWGIEGLLLLFEERYDAVDYILSKHLGTANLMSTLNSRKLITFITKHLPFLFSARRAALPPEAQPKKKRGNPGDFIGSRREYLLGWLPRYIEKAKAHKIGEIWDELFVGYWQRFPWCLDLKQEPDTSDEKDYAAPPEDDTEKEMKEVVIPGAEKSTTQRKLAELKSLVAMVITASRAVIRTALLRERGDGSAKWETPQTASTSRRIRCTASGVALEGVRLVKATRMRRASSEEELQWGRRVECPKTSVNCLRAPLPCVPSFQNVHMSLGDRIPGGYEEQNRCFRTFRLYPCWEGRSLERQTLNLIKGATLVSVHACAARARVVTIIRVCLSPEGYNSSAYPALTAPAGPAPKRLADFQYYMQHKPYKTKVNVEYEALHVGAPPGQRLQLRAAVTKDLFAREPAEVQKAIKEEVEGNHEVLVTKHKEALEGFPSLDEEEQAKAHARFSSFVSPLLDGLKAHTGYEISLLAGRVKLEEGKVPDVECLSVHAGVTSETPAELDFSRANPRNYGAVATDFVRFILTELVQWFLPRLMALAAQTCRQRLPFPFPPPIRLVQHPTHQPIRRRSPR
ncbi:hypothetical protein DFH09DRAFT_1100884 [Mycena vulgaris]|nr:hypothetical protein DFH09DRAFT_1100884 [Mycena vulgaris]